MSVIMTLAAHPDDSEIFAGGTLARFAERGDSVVICYASMGDKGSTTDANIATIRAKEAKRSAKVIGAETHCMGLKDGEIHDTPETREAFLKPLKRYKPDIVLTHSSTDYMGDHNLVSRLAQDCSFTAPLGVDNEYATIPSLFFMDSMAGVGFHPEMYVDITGTMEKKLEMMRQHKSQLVFLGEYLGYDFLEYIDVVARFRGLQSGVRYAEGFREVRTYPRGVCSRKLP